MSMVILNKDGNLLLAVRRVAPSLPCVVGGKSETSEPADAIFRREGIPLPGAPTAGPTFSLYLLPLGAGAWKVGISSLREAVEAQDDAKKLGHRTLLEGDTHEAQALYEAYLADMEHCNFTSREFSWETFQQKWESGELRGAKPHLFGGTP